jgi:hypothetical protein
MTSLRFPLTAQSNTRFSRPGSAAVLTFAGAPDGSVKYEFQRPGAAVINGTKKP